MEIRKYTFNDEQAVLNLLSLNTPKFFDESEKTDLIHYLTHEIEDYFVVEENLQIVAAGGINYFPKTRSACLSWDIVSPSHQGKGIGRLLTQHRVKLLHANPQVDQIIVRTSQWTHEFYQKMKFRLVRIEEDYWAKGYHLYLMERSAVLERHT